MMINDYKVKRLQQGLRPASVNRELATMKKAFNLALKEWQWIPSNPVSRIALERENNKRDRWLTPDEETRLLKASPAWLRDFILFALNTGMRLGEILSLSWRGVDLDRKTVTVFESKNDEKRTIPINDSTVKMLKRMGKVRSIKTDLVFYSSCHTKLDARNVRRDFQEALKKARIEDFRFHDLRHTFATRLVQNGVDIYKVQTLLGHKTPSMTQRYAHHYPESLRDGVDMLDRIRKSTKIAQFANRKVSKND
jgi:site-specific recombinase XerD